MPNDEKNQNTPSIWAWKNTAHIAKMGIEGTVAVASLATAIATIFIVTGTIAGPAFLASVANPVGIVALFVAAAYFTAAAYSSYQQMHKNEEISGADITGQANKAVNEAVNNAKIADQATKAVNDAKGNLVGKDEVVSTLLDQLEGENVGNLKAKLGLSVS